MSVRAITFDFWCTLFRDAHSQPRQLVRIKALAELAGVTEQEAADALTPVWARFHDHHIREHRTLSSFDAVDMACGYLGVSLKPKERGELAEVFAEAVVTHSPEPIDGAIDAVRAAAARVPIGIISDTGVSPGRVLVKLLDRHAFTEHFTALTFSDEMGVAKPDAKMFESTAGQLGVSVSEILHIGDRDDTDILGARAVGAQAALFAGDNDSCLNEHHAHYVYLSWSQFLEHLPTLVA